MFFDKNYSLYRQRRREAPCNRPCGGAEAGGRTRRNTAGHGRGGRACAGARAGARAGSGWRRHATGGTQREAAMRKRQGRPGARKRRAKEGAGDEHGYERIPERGRRETERSPRRSRRQPGRRQPECLPGTGGSGDDRQNTPPQREKQRQRPAKTHPGMKSSGSDRQPPPQPGPRPIARRRRRRTCRACRRGG